MEMIYKVTTYGSNKFIRIIHTDFLKIFLVRNPNFDVVNIPAMTVLWWSSSLCQIETWESMTHHGRAKQWVNKQLEMYLFFKQYYHSIPSTLIYLQVSLHLQMSSLWQISGYLDPVNIQYNITHIFTNSMSMNLNEKINYYLLSWKSSTYWFG